MATKFEDLVDNMVNIGFGAAATAAGVAATAAVKGKEVLDGLAAKGEEARRDPEAPDFARSMSDIFQKAGGAFSDVTERLSTQGETVAERVLDELILARVRQLSADERATFIKHVSDLVNSADDDAVAVKVESVETEAAPAPGNPAASEQPVEASADATANGQAGE